MQANQQTQPTARQEALALFAGAERSTLDALWARWENKPRIHLVRTPETGLVMVRGRTGGGGAPFNLGEATVSRASVRIETGEIGHGYCLGRDTGKAQLIATLDALFQREADNVELAIVGPLRAAQLDADSKRDAETAATKVDFFTMVRGDD